MCTVFIVVSHLYCVASRTFTENLQTNWFGALKIELMPLETIKLEKIVAYIVGLRSENPIFRKITRNIPMKSLHVLLFRDENAGRVKKVVR